MTEGVKHLRVTYNDIHNLIRKATPKIANEFNPDLLVAIGAPNLITFRASPDQQLFFRWWVS